MSGAVLGMALVSATVAVMASTLMVCASVAESARLAGAADAAALAAADAVSGRVGDAPCAAAERLADTNDAALAACLVDGLVVTVLVVSPRWIGPQAAATAGPAGISSG